MMTDLYSWMWKNNLVVGNMINTKYEQTLTEVIAQRLFKM